MIESVEETHHRILDDVVAAITDTKRNFSIELEKIIAEYKAISQQLQGERGGLLSSVTQSSASGHDCHGREDGQDSLLVLGFSQEHHNTADQEQTALQTHLDDWAKIQDGIVGLVAEVLGPERVSGHGHDPAGCGSQIAASAFSRPIGYPWSQRTNTRIKGLTAETEKQLVTQEKVNRYIP